MLRPLNTLFYISLIHTHIATEDSRFTLYSVQSVNEYVMRILQHISIIRLPAKNNNYMPMQNLYIFHAVFYFDGTWFHDVDFLGLAMGF
jgi:hypothetical protein